MVPHAGSGVMSSVARLPSTTAAERPRSSACVYFRNPCTRPCRPLSCATGLGRTGAGGPLLGLVGRRRRPGVCALVAASTPDAATMTCRHFGALMRKNAILKWRSPLSSFCEFCLPMGCVVVGYTDPRAHRVGAVNVARSNMLLRRTSPCPSVSGPAVFTRAALRHTAPAVPVARRFVLIMIGLYAAFSTNYYATSAFTNPWGMASVQAVRFPPAHA